VGTTNSEHPLSFPNPTIHRLTGGGNLPDGSADWIMDGSGKKWIARLPFLNQPGSQVARGQRRSKKNPADSKTPAFFGGSQLILGFFVYLPLLDIYHSW